MTYSNNVAKLLLECNYPSIDIMTFFKTINLYDYDTFSNIRKKSNIILFESDDIMYSFVGCFPKVNRDNIIEDYKLCLPQVRDLPTLLIYIHEMIHSIILESRIGKIYDRICQSETLPIFYEWLYVQNTNDENIMKSY